MNLFDLGRRSYRNLSQTRTRTFLTASAISVGAFALALTIALGTSVNALAEKLLFSGQERTTLTVTKKADFRPRMNRDTPQEYVEEEPDFFDFGGGPPAGDGGGRAPGDGAPGGGPPGRGFALLLTKEELQQVEKLPGVENVERPYEQGVDGKFVEGPNGKRFKARGVSWDEPAPALLAGTAKDLNAGKLILPEFYLRPLGFSSAAAAIGQKVQFGFAKSWGEVRTRSYTVCAVASKPTGLFGFSRANAVYLSKPDITDLYEVSKAGTPGYGDFAQVTVQAGANASPEELAALRDRIQSLGDGRTFQAQTRADSARDQAGFVRNIQIALGAFAGIILFASLFGVVNTQLMSVFQRTREIGLMKALGMSRGAITVIFLFEAMFIGLLGGLQGIGAAYLVARLLDPWIVQRIANLGVSGRFLIFNPIQLAELCLALMTIAALAGVVPARTAAKLDPIDALRTE